MKRNIVALIVALVVCTAAFLRLQPVATELPSRAAPGRPVNSGSDQPDDTATAPRMVLSQSAAPGSVDLREVPAGPPEKDELLERYLSGELIVTDQDRQVDEMTHAELVLESLRQPPDRTVQNYQVERAPTGTLNNAASFNAVDYSESLGGVPPDPDIMVGKDHIVVGTNTAFQVFDKTGTSLVAPTQYSALWGDDCGTGSGISFFDPFSVYDESTGRYFMGITAVDYSVNGGDNGYACIAVSKTDSATGEWHLYSFDGNPGAGTDYFFDYPHIGVGQDAIYLSSNMFGGNSFARSHVFAFEKANMLTGAVADSVKFNVANHFTLQPAKMKGHLLGGWATDENEPHYFVDASSSAGRLTVWEFKDPWGTPSFTEAGTVTVNSYQSPVNNPQQGGSALQGNDTRMLDLEYWGGKLWATHTVGCNPGSGTVNCVRWYEIDVTGNSPSLVQQGTLSSNSVYRAFPNLAVNKCGDMLVGYTQFSSTTRPSVYVAGREAEDTLGVLKDETLLKAGESVYSSFDDAPHRWGDYTGMALDPDGVTMWYVGEYSSNQNNSDWSTWVGGYTWSDCSAAPDYTFVAVDTLAEVCAGSDATYIFDVDGLNGFESNVTLATANLPTNALANFSANPVVPSTVTTLTVGTANVASGTHAFQITADSSVGQKSIDATLNVLPVVLETTTLVSPTSAAVDVSPMGMLQWAAVDAAENYQLQVATDPAFATVVVDTTVADPTFTPTTELSSESVYYWRVRATSVCATAEWSTPQAFFTEAAVTGSVCTDMIVDGGFEAGGAWSESSSRGFSVRNNVQPVDTGAYGAWLGGDDDETGQTWQSVLIPADAVSAELSYRYAIRSIDFCGYDFGYLRIDGVNQHTYSLCNENATGFTTSATVDLIAKAGSSTEIRYVAVTDGSNPSDLFIDNVSLDVCTPASEPISADFSDADLSYGVAWHAGNGTVYLGSDWTADGNFSAAHDSDDGVQANTLAGNTTNSIVVNVGGTFTGANGWLQVWVDWDDSGTYESGELAYNAAVATGANNIDIAVPDVTGDFNYRARLLDSETEVSRAIDPTGSAESGEVEDGSLNVGIPTAVNMSSTTSQTIPLTALLVGALLLLLTGVALKRP